MGKEVCCKKAWCVVVSAWDFQLEDKMISGFRPGFLCNFTPHPMSLSAQVYKWLPVNHQADLTKCWGVTL